MSMPCCDYRDHGGNLADCACTEHPRDSLHPFGWCTWCGGRGCPDCLGPDENACVECGSNARPCLCPSDDEPSRDNPSVPPHLAVDADGYVWRVYGDGYWSMARINPDNSLTPAPITYYAPLTCPGCGVGIRPGVAACNPCMSEANTDPSLDNEAFEGWGPEL